MQNKQQKEREKKKVWAIFHPQSDHARHFLNWCDIYRAMKVVHRSWSDNHYNQSYSHSCLHSHTRMPHAHSLTRTNTCTHARTRTHSNTCTSTPTPPPLLHLFGFRFLELVKQITASTSHQMPTLFST